MPFVSDPLCLTFRMYIYMSMLRSDDNSIISMHPKRMEDLNFFNGRFSYFVLESRTHVFMYVRMHLIVARDSSEYNQLTDDH